MITTQEHFEEIISDMNHALIDYEEGEIAACLEALEYIQDEIKDLTADIEDE